MDGRGEFQYVANPQPLGPEPTPPQPDPRLRATPKSVEAQQVKESATNPIQGVANALEGVSDAVKKVTGTEE